jgi:hypothetical protein
MAYITTDPTVHAALERIAGKEFITTDELICAAAKAALDGRVDLGQLLVSLATLLDC